MNQSFPFFNLISPRLKNAACAKERRFGKRETKNKNSVSVLEPNPDAQKKYDAAFPVYQKLYRSLKEDLRAIATSPDLPRNKRTRPEQEARSTTREKKKRRRFRRENRRRFDVTGRSSGER